MFRNGIKNKGSTLVKAKSERQEKRRFIPILSVGKIGIFELNKRIGRSLDFFNFLTSYARDPLIFAMQKRDDGNMKNRDDLSFPTPAALGVQRHSEPQAKNPEKNTFKDWILRFAFAPLRMTIPTLTLAAMLAMNLSTSWAAECPSGVCASWAASCTCNEEGKKIEDIYYDGYYKEIATYDALGNQISYVTYAGPDSIANNKPDWKMESTYDGTQLVSSVRYSSAEAIEDNRPNSKSEYTYDAAGNPLSSVEYDSAEAIEDNRPNSKSEYTYDAAGNQLSSVRYYGAEAIEDNKPDWKWESTYDGSGHELSRIFYESAEAIENNRPDLKYEYTYDGSGHELSRIDYNSAEAIENNSPDTKYESTYDAEGNYTAGHYSSSTEMGHTDISIDGKTVLFFDDGRITVWGNDADVDYDADGNITSLWIYGTDRGYIDCSVYPDDCLPYLNPPKKEFVCVYGYIEGCIAGEVTLADGSKVMMKNGQIDESSCYSQGKVFWNNACLDEYPFAKKKWTPAEAAQWLNEDDNTVTITFKK